MTSLTNLPPVAKLSSRIIRILGCNPGPFTLQGTNTYLVGTGHRRVLVDTGEKETSDAYIKLLSDVLREENASIEHMVITHWHHDHIGGVEAVRDLLRSQFPTVNQPTVWKLPQLQTDLQKSRDNPTSWKPLVDNQVVEVEGAKLQVKYTPGHTSDHICLLLQDENALFSGDCVLGEGTTVFEDLQSYLLSLEKIVKMQPKVIYPGHGPVLDDPLPRVEYYIQHRKQRELEILQVLEEGKDNQPKTAAEIVQKMYKGLPEKLLTAAEYGVQQHLDKLLKERKVFKNDEDGWWKVKGKI